MELDAEPGTHGTLTTNGGDSLIVADNTLLGADGQPFNPTSFMLCNAGLSNPPGWQQRQKKNIELLTEMARVLGYGKAITHLDVDRIYSPVGLQERLERARSLERSCCAFSRQRHGLKSNP